MTKINVKIGFVPSYRPYGPIPPWVVDMRASAIAALKEIEGLDLIYPQIHPDDPKTSDPLNGYSPDGCVCNLDEAEVVAEYFMHQKVQAIIIGALNFGDERSAIKIAELLKVPVFVYATKEPPALTDNSLRRVSDSYCGTITIAAGLYRRELSYHYGGIFFHDEPEFTQAVDAFLRAIAVKQALTNARIGQIGVRPVNFESVSFDEIAMAKKFGQNVIFSELYAILNQAQELTDDDPRVVEVFQGYHTAANEITIKNDWILKAAKVETAITNFWKDNKLSAISIQCWPVIQGAWKMSMCAMLGSITGKDMLIACEADTLGALAMLAGYSAALGKSQPHFVDWTIQHRDNPNWFLSWHCGNAPVSLAKDPEKIALRQRFDMVGAETPTEDDIMAGLFQFQIKPGEVTFCRLSEVSDRWKMLIVPGQIIPSDEELAGTWAWVEVRDHERLYRTIVENGFIHHASMMHGNQVESLTLACKLMDIEPVIVD